MVLHVSEPVQLSSKPRTNPELPESYTLPDFDTIFTYERGFHPDAKQVSHESAKWFMEAFPESFDEGHSLICDSDVTRQHKHWDHLMQDTSRLASYCHPRCSKEMLRVSSDFMVYIFHVDDVSDAMLVEETRTFGEAMMSVMTIGENEKEQLVDSKEESGEVKLARDFWTRFKANLGPLSQRRFLEGLQYYFEGVSTQAKHRQQGSGVIPDVESFIALRRDTGAFRPCLSIVEACSGIELSDNVINHPILAEMMLASNDVIVWSNDVFSYNVEQSINDTHNLPSVLMHAHDLSLQEAVDKVFDMCRDRIQLYNELKSRLPSFGSAKADADVAEFVRGLEDWIMGTYRFSFDSSRYFREQLGEVKRSRVVKLFPKVET